MLIRINRVIRERKLRDERDQILQNLKSLSVSDSLTELYNARYFYIQLYKEIKRAERHFHPLSLIFIDIDKLKVINDTYGHMFGDKVLLFIAQKIKASLRSEDAAYRYAGDEFTVILPETTSKEAVVVAERIRSEIQNESVIINEKEISSITVSLGIAEYQKNEEIEKFVHRADLEMYKSKGKGGNKIAIATKIIELSTV